MVDSEFSLQCGAMFEGRYEVLARLGEGGFGAVYKARQCTTGQAIALKIMHLPEHDGEARREKRSARFLREMHLCAELHHPNIVQLVDAGRTGGGLLYSVFSFAPGDNLADLLAREGAISPREARHLMLQVLDALACAHAQGVVHRDLKPRNIMVIPTGARRNALVLDFGIGAITDGSRTKTPTRLTATNEALGTPGYAAPEQWRDLDPTPRADLFAWGLVFLECMTGMPVYGGGSVAEIVYQQLSPEPVPLPPALERHPLGEILRAVTRKDVAARAVTAAGLFAELEACDLRDLSRGAMFGVGGSSAGAGEQTTWEPRHGAAEARGANAVKSERRQVTALCCTLSALAEGRDALDIEEHDELLRAALALCTTQAGRHRGHLAATLGDEVLLHFGYPRAEEDDARRAARAALAIVAAVEVENERLAGRGARVEVRIGIHTGLVVAGDPREPAGAGVEVGATARLAARLAAQAPPGSISVSAEALRLLRAAFELDAQGSCVLEGVAGALKVYRLEREQGDHAPTPMPGGDRVPLVGREQEMDLLLERWRRTRLGAGQCSLVTGEPGIGKSRLAHELRDRLTNESHTFLEGRCSPDTQHNALYPLLGLLGRALGLDREPAHAGRVARLEAQLTRHGFTPVEAMPLFLPLFGLPLGEPYAPLDVSPQKRKELTLNAIFSLIFTLAEERPVLLLIEDLHWADPMTIELLTQLVREAPSASLCLLLTARPEFSPAFPTTGMLQLHLSRLERPQVEAMVREMVKGKALPPVVLDQVARRTDGVPLFVEELTRMMVGSGVLVEQEDRFELARPLSEVEIPGTLRALLTARLDRLGRAKETAQLAAALGREFNVDVLSAVSPLGAAAVQEDLDRLMGAGLLFRKRRMKDPGCMFKHALVRDAAYESLARGPRQETHARIARTLEERFPEIAETRPELLAQHHAAAEQKREAIGYAQRAAMGALMRSAYAEAIGHASEALSWLDAIDGERERADLELELNGVITPALMSTRGWADSEIKSKVERSLHLIERVVYSLYSMPTLWALVLFYHVGGH